ncbi:hypothetical protein VTJ83DRAFT_5019 [Remersonia thermophila]|uniref:Ubiquitin-protein ligase n=1 Tax=Remersonia thermophila TaxID=72144 RepID=A0ABR4DBK9_9PEZI
MADDALPEAVAAALPSAIENASAWRNFTLWTQQLGLTINMSRLAPSLEHLVMAGPRMVMKLGKLGSFISFPDAIDGFGQRVVPDAPDLDAFSAAATAAAGDLADTLTSAASASASASDSASIAAAAAAAADAVTENPAAFLSRVSTEGAKSLGGVFSYATSKWALSCIAMAVIFNRTHIFAATRRRLQLKWHVRLLLRAGPLILLLLQARWLLQSIQCQTSPDFAELRWANASKSSELMFSYPNPVFNKLSSALLLGASDAESCRSVKMVPWDDRAHPELSGSLSRLWPLFETFCVSQFVEVLSCAVQGRPVAAETGMTIFEHSLAFAEADASISNQLGWSLSANGTSGDPSALESKMALTRAMILKRVNTAPEVLLVAFFSAMSHATSHILGILNVQSKYRLFSTGFWGLCFMAGLLWSAFRFSIDDPAAQGLLRFPTVCIIGFIPHVLILLGIFSCGVVYVSALTLSALASPNRGPDGEQLSVLQRIVRAHGNMQANVSLSEIRIRTDMDFYTALLRAGFGAINMASEAVYLNEDQPVNLASHTWLEEERLRELEELRMQWISGGIPGSHFDSVGTIGLVPIKDGQAGAASGYAREKAAQQVPKAVATGRRTRNGVGAAERSARWLIAFEYLMHVFRLVLVVWASFTLRFLALFGMRTSPRWLHRLSQAPKHEPASKKKSSRRDRLAVDILPQGRGVYLTIPHKDDIDVEEELRRWMRSGDRRLAEPQPIDEADLDSKLYDHFARGGFWGERDSSGDYVPPAGTDADDMTDTTSVISTTETASELDWESAPEEEDGDDDHDADALGDGQRTPTQQHYHHQQPQQQPFAPRSFASAVASARASREPTPAPDNDDAIPLSAADLVRLLNPQSPEDRDEALTIAAHLSSEGIMTRSRFRALQQRQRAKVLLTNARLRPAAGRGVGVGTGGAGVRGSDRMTPEEEARALEQLLLSRRRAAAGASSSSSSPWVSGGLSSLPPSTTSSSSRPGTAAGAGTWATGANGLGPDGPLCVVCQSEPRTVIVWPCRCLCLCDECRVSLAMNNFDKCVCCRREVMSFSRIYVP